MIDPTNPRPCPNCDSPNTRISDFDPPFSATLTCDTCEYDSTLDEDNEPQDIQRRDLFASLGKIEDIDQKAISLCNESLSRSPVN